jgi:MFS transporter, Spinster family, sphingosine-1-phosphate transporter
MRLFSLQLLSGATFVGAIFCFGAFCFKSLYGFIPSFAVGELSVFATQVIALFCTTFSY